MVETFFRPVHDYQASLIPPLAPQLAGTTRNQPLWEMKLEVCRLHRSFLRM
jgi:hypothetical protein